MTIKKILVANRSEIAIRVFRAANELNIKTVACYAEEDKLALHRFKADEAYLIGKGKGPVEAYLQIDEYIRVARLRGADAIHPGYGLLSESPEFAEACEDAGIIFIGPRAADHARPRQQGRGAQHGDRLGRAGGAGDRSAARRSRRGRDDGGRDRLPADAQGELGRRRARHAPHHGREPTLIAEVSEGKREAKAAFGKDEMYLEKLIERARHVEVQLIGDDHGNLVHLFERDCSVQRRNQKVVERAPAPYLSEKVRKELTDAALKLGNAANYRGAGTVEFLMDADTDKFYFIEVNPRIQVEHTVTEEVTGIDIVKAQIRLLEGAVIGTPESGVPQQEDIRLNGNAIQCRITTEDPEENFIPDYGRITAYREATGFGVRLDGGTAYAGAIITRFYDPLLEKVTCWAPTAEEAIARMHRALREFRIRGVRTNLAFLENIITHPDFVANRYTTRFIDTTPALFEFTRRKDRATKLLTYIADVTVNGHPEVRDRPRPPADAAPPVVPRVRAADDRRGHAPGARARRRQGPRALAEGPEAGALHRHDDARRAPVAARDAHAQLRHHAHRAGLFARAAEALLARMLGRRDVRRRHALPQRGPVGAACRGPRRRAQHPDPDAAPRLATGSATPTIPTTS